MKLSQYEKSALRFYTDNAEERRIVTHKNCDSESMAAKASTELGNPYRTMHQWIQMEVMELMSLQ